MVYAVQIYSLQVIYELKIYQWWSLQVSWIKFCYAILKSGNYKVFLLNNINNIHVENDFRGLDHVYLRLATFPRVDNLKKTPFQSYRISIYVKTTRFFYKNNFITRDSTFCWTFFNKNKSKARLAIFSQLKQDPGWLF